MTFSDHVAKTIKNMPLKRCSPENPKLLGVFSVFFWHRI